MEILICFHNQCHSGFLLLYNFSGDENLSVDAYVNHKGDLGSVLFSTEKQENCNCKIKMFLYLLNSSDSSLNDETRHRAFLKSLLDAA